MIKIAVILGTRPEIIKLSPIIRKLEKERKDFVVIHTNQHYSENMDKIFFKELGLNKAKYNLGVGSSSHAVQTARMMIELEPVLVKERPTVVIVQGDTNTVLAGSVVSAKLGIKVAHVEAGLRSYDRTMPEEHNRVIADHVADYCFTPTAKQSQILLNEGIDKKMIFTVGNTIVDAVKENVRLVNREENRSSFGYVLMTLHRPSNVDDPKRLNMIINTIRKVSDEFNLEVAFPVHPRTKKIIDGNGISLKGINVLEPQGYLSFLKLQAGADIIVTDSGGVQEEACILRVPCLTVRPNTERPETIEVGASRLSGESSSEIKRNFKIMLSTQRSWPNPFGDGKAADKIVKYLEIK